MFIFKKKKVSNDTPKKPIYKKNPDKNTYIIICPYCNSELREVYYMNVASVNITSCCYCGKHFA